MKETHMPWPEHSLNESSIGQANIKIKNTDFIFSDFFADLGFTKYEEEHIETIKEWLNSSFHLFRLQYGAHPNHFNLVGISSETLELRFKTYTADEIQEFKELEPWQCFPDTKNAIDLYVRMHECQDNKFSGLYEVETYPAALAILISETPKTSENFLSITKAALHLAAQLVGEHLSWNYTAMKILEKHSLISIINGTTAEERKQSGRKKGGDITGQMKRTKAQAKDSEMKAWAFEDRKNNSSRGQAKRLIKRFKVSERKARSIIASIKK